MKDSFAVITGPSSGIDIEFAKKIGQEGFELLIVSNSDEIFEV